MQKNKPTFRKQRFQTLLSKNSLCLLLLFFLSKSAFGQEPIYQHFGVDHGLPSTEVYDVYQDKEGYIWFATDKGLSQFNGYEFKNYTTSDGLTGNVVLRFYPLPNGQIWCFSLHTKSLFYFEEVFNGFKPYKYNDVLCEVLKEKSIIKSLYFDENNNLHLSGTSINGEQIIKADGSTDSNYISTNSYLDSLSNAKLVLLNYENTETSPFYFSTKDTSSYPSDILYVNHTSNRMIVDRFEGSETAIFMTDSIVQINPDNQDIIDIYTPNMPIGLKVIDSTHFLVGYLFGGAKIIDKKGKIQKEFLIDKSVTSFLIDHEGGYWFSTLYSGVYYIKNPSSNICNVNGTKSRHINSMCKTNENELLIGYKDGTIAKLNKDKSSKILSSPNNTTHSFVEYDLSNNNSYLYNNMGLNPIDDIKYRFFYYSLKLSEPVDNTVFSSHSAGFIKIRNDQDNIEFSSPYRVLDVCLWDNDTIIATPNGIFSYSEGYYLPLSNQKLFSHRSDDIDVNSDKSTMYIATHGAGVIVYNRNQFTNITTSDGLVSNIVNEIYVENDSIVWACTNMGISRIVWSENDVYITSFDKNDGLLNNDIEDIELINDTVYVGTKQGLCVFPKSQMEIAKWDAEYLKLKDVHINTNSRKDLKNPKLSYKENEINFLLEGISYSKHKDLHYQYRLNKNQNWTKTQNRSIHISSLSSGKYVFEAKMCIDDHTCSEKMVQYKFTILPPFWERWWFVLSCLSAIGLLIYTFFKTRVFTYNKDVTRELLRLIIRKLKNEEMYFKFRENGNHVRIKTENILYIKSAANYIDVYTTNKKHTIRLNIGKFLDNVPDKLEYVRLHRSYIVRIDKIASKSSKEVRLINGIKIPVSLNYNKQLKEVVF